MTIDEAIKFVGEFSVGNGSLKALGLEISATKGRDYIFGQPDGTVEILLYFSKVPDREDGSLPIRPEGFQHHIKIGPYDLSMDNIGQRIRNGLQRAMAHEVDEGLLYQGRRIFDPHAGENRRRAA